MPVDLQDQLKLNQFDVLNNSFEHAFAVKNLPHLHKNPFDRLLVVQVQMGHITLVMRDTNIQRYDVKILVA